MDLSTLDDTVVSARDGIIKTHDADLKFNPNGLGDQFYKLMLNNSSKIAQIDGITGKTETYKDLLSRCVKTARAMRKLGIKPGDIITPCTGNHLDTCVPFVASLFVGAHCAPIDLGLPEDEMKNLLDIFQPKIIFCSPNAEEYLELKLLEHGLKTMIVVFGNTNNHVSFEEFLGTVLESGEFEVYKARNLLDTAYITLTGGSTGKHKAVCLHHLSMFNFVKSSSYGPMRDKVLVSFSPQIWISGPFAICRAITFGCARLIFPKFVPNIFFQLIDKYKITNLTVSSFVITQILKESIPKGVDISTLKSLSYTGSAVSNPCLKRLRKMLPQTSIVSSYGQSEAGGYLTIYDWTRNPHHLELKSGSIGRPMKGITYKVVDIQTGKVLGPNQPGHLLVKTGFQMNGYYKCNSSHVWDEEGWLKTGDIAYYDEQYFFYFVDRLKEMMRYRSWSIPPQYLEGILMKHPSVELAFVTAVPNDEDGDHPIAAVVLKNGGNVTSEKLEKFVNDQVEETRKLREGVKIVKWDFVPYSAAGKIKRYEFRRKLLKLLEYDM